MKNISLKTLAQNVLKKLNTKETEKKETETFGKLHGTSMETKGKLTREQAKIEPTRETQQMEYRPTCADLELEQYIGRPSTNSNGYRCINCGVLGERYCLGQDRLGKWWWGWHCLKCRPYIEPERN